MLEDWANRWLQLKDSIGCSRFRLGLEELLGSLSQVNHWFVLLAMLNLPLTRCPQIRPVWVTWSQIKGWCIRLLGFACRIWTTKDAPLKMVRCFGLSNICAIKPELWRPELPLHIVVRDILYPLHMVVNITLNSYDRDRSLVLFLDLVCYLLPQIVKFHQWRSADHWYLCFIIVDRLDLTLVSRESSMFCWTWGSCFSLARQAGEVAVLQTVAEISNILILSLLRLLSRTDEGSKFDHF